MKLVRESISFQKHKDPKVALGISFNPYKEFVERFSKEDIYGNWKADWKKFLTDTFVGHIVHGTMYLGDETVSSTEEKVIRIVLDTAIPNFSFVVKNGPDEIQSERWYYVYADEKDNNILKIS